MHLKKTLSKNKLTYKHSFCILNWCGKLLMSVEDQHLLPLWSHTLNALLSFVGQLHGAPASVYVPPPPGGRGRAMQRQNGFITQLNQFSLRNLPGSPSWTLAVLRTRFLAVISSDPRGSRKGTSCLSMRPSLRPGSFQKQKKKGQYRKTRCICHVIFDTHGL